MTSSSRVFLYSLLALIGAYPAAAAPAPPARCEQMKLIASASAGQGLIRCYARAAGRGTAVDPACLTKVTDRLAAKLVAIESRQICGLTGEAPAVTAALATLAETVSAGSGSSPCDRAKLRAAGIRVKSFLRAQAKHSSAPELDKLADTLDAVTAKFADKFVAAESRGGCSAVGNATAIAAALDHGVDGALDAVRGTLGGLAASTGRRMGAAVRANILASMEAPYRTTLLRHFNFVTAEYELMWGNLEPTQGNYLYGPIDTTVDFAVVNGLELKGAPLVWHLILPAWVNAGMTPAALQSAVDLRIDTLVGRYAGRVRSWDVVNEATPDGGGGYRNTIFLQKLGVDYIRNAFIRARAADPDALLFYNDFLADGINAKSNFIYSMIQGLLAAGTPIDGVGFQMHLGGSFGAVPPADSVRQNLQRFADLGLRVRISELDVQTSSFAGSEAEKSVQQRAVYHDMVAACLDVSGCESITFWGLTDKYTWVNDYLVLDDTPLPFDTRYREKAAFFGVRDALLGF